MCGIFFSLIKAIKEPSFLFLKFCNPINSLFGLIILMFDVILQMLLQVLFFSTMTRLLDVMEEYLTLKQYRYLRLDGHTSGGDRGALIEKFNQPGSPYFIFLLR